MEDFSVETDEAFARRVRISKVAMVAKPALLALLNVREQYPRSYSRERVMEKADDVLDTVIDMIDLEDAPSESVVELIGGTSLVSQAQ